MTTDQKTATLASIFSDILTDLAFMFTDDQEADLAPGDTWLETVIGYAGSQCGTLRLRCTRDFSIRLAANLLGIDANDDDAQTKASDAVKEFMNVVCGHLVTTLHGTEEAFNLTIPSIRELPQAPDLSDQDAPHISTLSVDGSRVQLSYTPSLEPSLDPNSSAGPPRPTS